VYLSVQNMASEYGLSSLIGELLPTQCKPSATA
jgi:hypothetical protein